MNDLRKLSMSEAMEVLHQLDLLLLNHAEWFNDVTRTIILDEPVSERFIIEHSHERCQFGKWFYNHLPKEIREIPICQDIEFIHKKLHLMFSDILRKWKQTKKVAKTDFNEATVKRLAFRLSVNTLQFMIYDYLLQTDPLTKTLNRTKMLSSLERERNRILISGEDSSVVMADIDYFKRVNDEYGHAVGDMVLVQTALFFSSVLRPTDLVFRFGGEEFLLYLSNLNKASTISRLNAICEKFSENNIMIATGKIISITASFGAAKLEPDCDIAESIEKADQALYAAKEGGRNRVVWMD